MTSLTRRGLGALGLGAALLAATPGFAEDLPYGLTAGKPYEGTTINVLAVVTPQFTGIALRDQEFTDLTGIEVQWTEVPFTALQEKVSSVGIAANGNFDVVNYLDSWGPANSDWLLTIDDLLERDGISMDRYPPAFARSAMFEGEVKGFPLRAHPQLMFYRKDVFDQLGLEPPATWDDVVSAGDAIRASDLDMDPLALYYGADGNRQNLFIWLNFLWGAGADVFTDDWQPGWTTPEAIQATKDYVALHTEHGVTAPSAVSWVEQEARIAFQQGKAAMMPVWWWAYSPMTNPDSSTLSKEQVGFAGMPTYGGNDLARTYAISMPYSISSYSQNQEAAWEFLKWLSNPDLEKRNATEREVAGTTIINNVVTHNANLTDPDVNAANDNIGYAAYDSLQGSDIMPQIAEWPQIGDLLSQAIAEAVAGGDVEELMTDAADQATRILRRAGYR